MSRWVAIRIRDTAVEGECSRCPEPLAGAQAVELVDGPVVVEVMHLRCWESMPVRRVQAPNPARRDVTGRRVGLPRPLGFLRQLVRRGGRA